MEVFAVKELVERVALRDLSTCRSELADLASVRAMLAQREVHIMRRLRQLGADGQGEHAAHTKGSSASASKAERRAEATEAVPQLDEALGAGHTTAEHVDAVARALAGLSAGDQARLAEHGDHIRAQAASLPEREFRRWLDGLVRRVRTDDAVHRLERQKRMCRARWWTDHEGMLNLAARFDPEAGIALQARLKATVEALFHGGVPEGAPLDPFERQQWLQALALAALVNGEAPAGEGSPDITVLIDAQTLLHGEHEHSVVDLGPFDLPLETIRRWACLGGVTPVVVGADGVRLMLGRTVRLANREQRRALRAWYRTCACCDVLFEHCEIHHVTWWELGGRTDIVNLLPLCSRHHHLAHEGGWALELGRDRMLRITMPNGEVREHGPPRARAA